MSGVNPLELSDEEFLNMNGPAEVAGGADESTPTTPVVEEPAVEAAATTEASEAAPTEVAEGADSAATTTEPAAPVTEEKPGEAAPVDPAPAADPASTVQAPASEAPAQTIAQAIEPDKAVEFYQQVMKPFKANGKMIELRSPEEVIGLMQMGANFTRKMQEIAPHRKTLMMLQNNGLDEAKLNFLIDLDKGDPEALKKFIKDRNIDPMDIDVSTDPAYLGGNHQVSDEEVAFRTVLEDLRSTPEGTATLKDINDRWDSASKELLWQEPSLLEVIQEQRGNGVYDAIAAEIDRRKTLGTLGSNVKFLDAYKLVGDELFAPRQPVDNAPAVQTPQVLATRPATPKPVADNDKVTAAAPSRGTATKAKETLNPQSILSMSDDEFLKQMQNRV